MWIGELHQWDVTNNVDGETVANVVMDKFGVGQYDIPANVPTLSPLPPVHELEAANENSDAYDNESKDSSGGEMDSNEKGEVVKNNKVGTAQQGQVLAQILAQYMGRGNVGRENRGPVLGKREEDPSRKGKGIDRENVGDRKKRPKNNHECDEGYADDYKRNNSGGEMKTRDDAEMTRLDAFMNADECNDTEVS